MTHEEQEMGFAEMFAKQTTASVGTAKRLPRIGQEITGRVTAITGASVFVDLGGKADGVIDRTELEHQGELEIAVGDQVSAIVAEIVNDNVILRKRLGRGEDASQELARAFEVGLPVSGKVAGINKGGAEVEIGKVRAFCPISQLDTDFVQDASTFVGRELEFYVTKFSANGRGGQPDVVLSRKRLLEQERSKQADTLRSQLSVGMVVTGTVKTLKDFGAFIDLGGLEGLVHISELGFARVRHPSEILKVGEKVDVSILAIEPNRDGKKGEKISLSLKALANNPWASVAEKLPAGTVVAGVVTRLEAYGAFVDLGEGLEGLVHVSQLADKQVAHPRDVVAVGAKIEAVVREIDPEKRRISLSMKAVAESKERDHVVQFGGKKSTGFGTLADKFKARAGK